MARKWPPAIDGAEASGWAGRPTCALGLVLVGSCWLACAPFASLRPASALLPDRSREVGAGLAFLGPRAGTLDGWHAAAQAWTTSAPDGRLSLSFVGAFDGEAGALGAALRWHLYERDRVSAAAELELGFAWVALSFPAALRLVDESWVYTAPRLGHLGVHPVVSLPLGASVRVVGGSVLRGEGQLSLQAPTWANPRPHAGVALAQQF